MKKKKPFNEIAVTKLNGKNIKSSDKIAFFAETIDVLTGVIKDTRKHCKSRKKKFCLMTEPYDPNNSIWLIDDAFRRMKWLSRSDLDLLEVNAGDYDEVTDIYSPSCDTILDIMIYIERIAYMTRDLCAD